MENETKKINLNSVQLNIVTFVDIQKATRSSRLTDSVFMMDNSTLSSEQGTSSLQTVCKQGQTLNWIIYPMNTEKKSNIVWLPEVRINGIIFLRDDGKDVDMKRVCNELKIYGGPDKVRSIYTPIYYYWAGVIPATLPVGVYKYRLVLELEDDKSNRFYLNLDTPSLKVISVTE